MRIGRGRRLPFCLLLFHPITLAHIAALMAAIAGSG
jgi:hypothetical protein